MISVLLWRRLENRLSIFGGFVVGREETYLRIFLNRRMMLPWFSIVFSFWQFLVLVLVLVFFNIDQLGPDSGTDSSIILAQLSLTSLVSYSPVQDDDEFYGLE